MQITDISECNPLISSETGARVIILVTSVLPFRYYPPKYIRNIPSFVNSCLRDPQYSHIVHYLCIGCISGDFGKREMMIIGKTGL
jgi:hypothetical protein